MFWASALPFIVVLVVCMAGCLACGVLAARKGYNIYLWTAAGGLLVSLVVLAFLPFVNKEGDGNNKQFEKTGNWIGAALAAVSLVSLASLILHIVGSV
jgi:dipeptide/tripeptide permease